MNDEQLRAAYRDSLAGRTTEGREGCVGPDEMIRLVEREGTEGDRLQTLDHVMACDACHAEFELLRAIAAGAESRPVATRAWMRPTLAAAAALAVLVGGTALWRGMQGPRPDVTRGGADTTVTVVSPLDPVTADRARTFVWRPVRGALRYELEITDGRGALVHDEVTFDTVTVLPDGTTLATGTEYRWWVTAVLPDGSRMRSEPRSFTPRQ